MKFSPDTRGEACFLRASLTFESSDNMHHFPSTFCPGGVGGFCEIRASARIFWGGGTE